MKLSKGNLSGKHKLVLGLLFAVPLIVVIGKCSMLPTSDFFSRVFSLADTSRVFSLADTPAKTRYIQPVGGNYYTQSRTCLISVGKEVKETLLPRLLPDVHI
jgi:hypothetical protein